MATITDGLSAAQHEHPDDFLQLAKAIQARAESIINMSTGNHLYVVDFTKDTLFNTFLSNLPEELRQQHRCNCCRDFLNRFGGVVGIDNMGRMVTIWSALSARLDGALEIYRDAVHAMAAIFSGRIPAKVFKADKPRLGVPQAGGFNHMSIMLQQDSPALMPPRSRKTAEQRMAELEENARVLKKAIRNWKPEHVAQAFNLVESGALVGGEKVAGPAKFLFDLFQRLATTKNYGISHNMVMQAVAQEQNNPGGYLNPRGSMIGALLDDIADGKPLEQIKRAFRERADPLRYMRPVAAPSAGNIAQAEKLVKELGIERSLARRFARLDEVQTIWEPGIITICPKCYLVNFHENQCCTQCGTQLKADKESVFGHLRGKRDITPPAPVLPRVDVSWAKFEAKYLPNAHKIEYRVPDRGTFMVMVTAQHEDAPPIIKWDSPDCRNPFTGYAYHLPPRANEFSLSAGTWVEVVGISNSPAHWRNPDEFQQHSQIALLVLKGAKDKNASRQGTALFPSLLRHELHEVRATIEAYSKGDVLGGLEETAQLATGVAISPTTASGGYVLRVHSDSGVTEFNINHWD